MTLLGEPPSPLAAILGNPGLFLSGNHLGDAAAIALVREMIFTPTVQKPSLCGSRYPKYPPRYKYGVRGGYT